MTETTTRGPQPEDSTGAAMDAVDEQLAAHLVEQARLEGTSLVGPDGLLQQLTKQALEEQGRWVRFLIRDRDGKFCRAFDDVFRWEGADVVLTPVQAPNANACAERWIRTIRAECLDWLLIVGRQHLERVLRVCVDHYSRHRPHRALGPQPPNPPAPLMLVSRDQHGRVHRRDLLGGLPHDYQRAAGMNLCTLRAHRAAGHPTARRCIPRTADRSTEADLIRYRDLNPTSPSVE